MLTIDIDKMIELELLTEDDAEILLENYPEEPSMATVWQVCPAMKELSYSGIAKVIDWFCEAAREDERKKLNARS